MLKYLHGVVYDLSGEPINALALTHKRDIYQHSDMARDIGLIPFHGGFADIDNKTGKVSNFHGESISCRVKTCAKANLEIEKILVEGDGYVVKFKDDNHPKVIIFVDSGKELDVLPVYESVEKIDSQEKIGEAISDCIARIGWY